MHTRTVLSLVALAALMPGTAFAASSTGRIDVSASVQASCTVGNAALAFGATGGGQADVAPTVTVGCTNGTAYTIALDNGQGGTAATAEARIMSATDTGGTKRTLTYSIYRDAARTQVWGSTPTSQLAGIGTGASVAVPLYARLFATTSGVSNLNYTDTVNITLTY